MLQSRQEMEEYLNPEIPTQSMPNESLDEDLKQKKWFEDVYLPWALELVTGVNREGWNYRAGETPDCLMLGEAEAQARNQLPEDIRDMLQSHAGGCGTCDNLV